MQFLFCVETNFRAENDKKKHWNPPPKQKHIFLVGGEQGFGGFGG